jgi:ketosteroid isomerase-like protein
MKLGRSLRAEQASRDKETFSMTTNPAIPADLAAALTQLEGALRAMVAGDPAPYAALWHRDADVTLFGAWGTVERGHDAVTNTFLWVGSRFSGGAIAPEYTIVAHSGDFAYTAGFERGRVSVDGAEPLDMTIRVTHILRRVDNRWWLVHRHADYPPADPRKSTPPKAA